MTVNGSDFVPGSLVQWNGATVSTTFVSPTQLTANVPGSLLASAGRAAVSVFSPTPGGGVSSPQVAFITASNAPVSAARAATSGSATGTATVSAGGSGPGTAGSLSATASGSGTVAVAEYTANPGSGPTFNSSGAYVDVAIAPGSSFSRLSIQDCNTNGGTTAYWYDGTAWHVASNQSYNSTTGCITITVDSTTYPSLSQLTGTPFATGVPPTITASATTANGKAYSSGTWTNQNVTVSFACQDGTSTATASAPVTIATDGESQAARGTCTDGAGASSSTMFGGIDVDKTPPTITISGVLTGTTYVNSVTPSISIQDLNARGTTDQTSGVNPAATSVTLNGQPFQSGAAVTQPGSETLVVAAADNAGNVAAQTVAFKVVHTTTLTTISSPTLAEGKVVIRAKLLDQGETPLGGQTVSFTAGGASASGTTDNTGTASATLSLPPGQYTVNASFAGDDDYLPSNASAQMLFVYQPTQFVVWGGNPGGVAAGQELTFWGSRWATQIPGSTPGAPALNSFKGYASQISGATWTSSPGNSSKPPASVASYVGVQVTTQAALSKATITGNVTETVVLRVDNPAAYAPDPGHSGSGVLVAVVQ